jgi:hypothetical protein
MDVSSISGKNGETPILLDPIERARRNTRRPSKRSDFVRFLQFLRHLSDPTEHASTPYYLNTKEDPSLKA